MSDAKTVLEYVGVGGCEWRIQVKPIPGSAHYNILRDQKPPNSDDWIRHSAIEARGKPNYEEIVHE